MYRRTQAPRSVPSGGQVYCRSFASRLMEIVTDKAILFFVSVMEEVLVIIEISIPINSPLKIGSK
jgi:hypothetical protein